MSDDVTRAGLRAAAVFATMSGWTVDERRSVVDCAADALAARASELVAAAMEETALTEARLTGEVDRTVLQLRFAGAYVMSGADLDIVVSAGELDPLRPRIIRATVPTGPVAVFGAGNFPFAFGALGTDTAAALAAGCPVIAKVHPSHPVTTAMLVTTVREALDAAGFDPDIVQFVGGGTQVGADLVLDPNITAVAFTGSPEGGRSLADLAAGRPDPIPVFAEMGSVNPVIVTPAAAQSRFDEIATGLLASVLASGGQLCTKPGLVFIPTGVDGDSMLNLLCAGMTRSPEIRLLDGNVAARFDRRLTSASEATGVTTAVRGSASGDRDRSPWLLQTRIDAHGRLVEPVREEIFGPALVVVRYMELGHVEPAIASLGGQLTATIHGEESDLSTAGLLVRQVERLAGRVVWNGFPTGVAIVEAMHHGGPWPASHGHTGSIGAESIGRFRRPMAWQGVPDALLPADVRSRV